jgi:hypothetical protein
MGYIDQTPDKATRVELIKTLQVCRTVPLGSTPDAVLLQTARDACPRLETLLCAFQSVTEGKIYVEIERARLTKRLARIKEEEGNIDEAADVLQEVAVVRRGPPSSAGLTGQRNKLPCPPDGVQQWALNAELTTRIRRRRSVRWRRRRRSPSSWSRFVCVHQSLYACVKRLR